MTNSKAAVARVARNALPSKRAVARSLLTAAVSATFDIGRLVGDR
jgi:hypothetical protein